MCVILSEVYSKLLHRIYKWIVTNFVRKHFKIFKIVSVPQGFLMGPLLYLSLTLLFIEAF